MEYGTCEQVREWADQITHERRFKPFADDALYRHVAGCDVCRGALIMLALAEPELLPAYRASSSSQHSTHLAAFVDAAELEPGSEVSIYPELWWHLLSCRECADEYSDLRAFARSLPAALAAPSQPAAPQRRSTVITRMALARDFLQVALPSLQQHRATVYRGRQTDTHVLAREDVAPGFEATLGLRQDSAEYWSVVVTIIPPRRWQVQLKVGDLERQATLDASGSVTIDAIPAEILLAADGPGMEVIIHRENLP